ncbi:hypothetical protein SteCoe_5234 [Stentor coeruleus]|uniref:Uncharacterized protein n=1 Tax=Stentor coeruleus TaxID=5963 RepID=A0A1R2CSP6_9CILI|nr:hypothetical protein SteCoe_5234 [Stentor coeruleus]
MEQQAPKRISRESSLSNIDSDSISFDIPPQADKNPNKALNDPNADIELWEQDFSLNSELKFLQDKAKFFKIFAEELERKLKVPIPKDSIDSISQALLKLMHNKIECTIYDLKQLIDDSYKIIQNFEILKIKNSTLHIGNSAFTLSILDKDFYIGKKPEISKLFLPITETIKKSYDFPNSFIDMCKNYEHSMQKAYENSVYSNIANIVPTDSFKKSSFLQDLQLQSYRANTLEQRTLKKELEWGKNEIKVLKGQLKEKIHEVQIKDRDNKSEFFKLKEERARLLKEKERIEKNSEDLDDKRRKFMVWAEGLRKIVDKLSEKSEVANHSSYMSMNNSFTSVEQSFINEEDEQKSLEAELKDLESQLFIVSPDKKDSLQTRINRIKTRIQILRSEKLVNQSSRRTTKLKSAVSNMQNVMGIKYPLPHNPLSASHRSIIPSTPFTQTLSTVKRSAMTPVQFSIAPVHNRSTTYTPPSPINFPIPQGRSSALTPTTERLELHAHMKSDDFYNVDMKKNFETDEIIEKETKSLLLREVRLAGKEEELAKKEKWIRSNLEKCSNDKEYLEIVKNERMNLNRTKKELEAKGKALEGKCVEIEKVQTVVRRKSECLDRKTMEIDADRMRLDGEREDLIQKIEDIKRFVEENL